MRIVPGGEEIAAVRALKQAFPDARVTLDPNGASPGQVSWPDPPKDSGPGPPRQ